MQKIWPPLRKNERHNFNEEMAAEAFNNSNSLQSKYISFHRDFFISSAIQASELQHRVLDQLNQSPKLDDLLKNDILHAQQSTEKKRFNVIIIPKQQFALPSAGASLEIYNEHIKKTTDKVLTFAPNKADFRLKRRFLSVNAIAAEVTLDGLHQLSNAPEVKFIGLDVGGQGALNEARPQVNISALRQQ